MCLCVHVCKLVQLIKHASESIDTLGILMGKLSVISVLDGNRQCCEYSSGYDLSRLCDVIHISLAVFNVNTFQLRIFPLLHTDYISIYILYMISFNLYI